MDTKKVSPNYGYYLCARKQNTAHSSENERSENKLDCKCVDSDSAYGEIDIPVKDCLLIQNLLEAFENREYEIIHGYFKQIVNYTDWQEFVISATGVGWNRWKTNIGFWLMRECQINPTAPFKALLPESETKEKD